MLVGRFRRAGVGLVSRRVAAWVQEDGCDAAAVVASVGQVELGEIDSHVRLDGPLADAGARWLFVTPPGIAGDAQILHRL